MLAVGCAPRTICKPNLVKSDRQKSIASASFALKIGKYAGHGSSFFNSSLGARPSRAAFVLRSDVKFSLFYSLLQ